MVPCHFRHISSSAGTLIEYAVILFKKQKRCKYGVAQAALARGQSLSASNPAHEYHQMASFPRPPNNEEASNLDPNRVGEVMSKSSSFYETQFSESSIVNAKGGPLYSHGLEIFVFHPIS